jgi:hypothetical protein
MEEDDAEVGARVSGLRHEAAVHVRVPARLVDEQLADVIEELEREAALVEDRGALERRHTAGNDAKRLAGGVVIRRLDYEAVYEPFSIGTSTRLPHSVHEPS